MLKKTFILLAICASTFSFAQIDSLNMQKLGNLEYSWHLSDVWGYVDSVNNKEYALVGAEDGFSVVNVTTPSNLVQELFIPGAYSIWRDIKTWSHYAYVSHDFQLSWSTAPSEGILIVDLDSLQSPRAKKFRPKFTLPNGQQDSLLTSHNIFIDEFGVLYVFGASGIGGAPLFNGGALMFDVNTDPWNPIYLGKFENYYLHDGYARDNILYGGAINIGVLAIIDVTIKTSPQVLGTKSTPNQFAHNTWLSDDGNTVFTTDEKPGAYVAAYDVSNLSNITEVDKFRTLPGTGVIPHNVHVKGDFLVTSYYTRGAQILDAEYPDLLVEVGYYDTSPLYSSTGYHGAWGAYPFLPSGVILITDIEEGLYTLSFDNKKASRLKGYVKDSLTGLPILQADVELAFRNKSLQTNINGEYKFGFEASGWDTLVVSKFGYQTRMVPFQFVTGNYDTLTIALLPAGFGVEQDLLTSFTLSPNPSSHEVRLQLNSPLLGKNVEIAVYDALGKKVLNMQSAYQPEITIKHSLARGMYIVRLEAEGQTSSLKMLVN